MITVKETKINIYENEKLIKTRCIISFEYETDLKYDAENKVTYKISSFLSKPHIISYDTDSIESPLVRNKLLATKPNHDKFYFKMSKGIKEELLDFLSNSLKQIVSLGNSKYKYQITKQIGFLMNHGIRFQLERETINEYRVVTVE